MNLSSDERTRARLVVIVMHELPRAIEDARQVRACVDPTKQIGLVTALVAEDEHDREPAVRLEELAEQLDRIAELGRRELDERAAGPDEVEALARRILENRLMDSPRRCSRSDAREHDLADVDICDGPEPLEEADFGDVRADAEDASRRRRRGALRESRELARSVIGLEDLGIVVIVEPAHSIESFHDGSASAEVYLFLPRTANP